MQKDQDILEAVLAEFQEIAKIPRKSGHEEKISQYLFDVIKAMGLKVEQDKKLNIIAEKPATKGFENMPVTILQGHMDMVCVAAEGVDFDPLNDSIQVRRNAQYLYAEGTSLGADDGIGVAEILYILKAEFAHGPLRAIITVDEEQGMSGSIALDPKHLAAKYLINCDSENYDVVTVSSAGSVNIDFLRRPVWRDPLYKVAYQITVKGLLGGHSGEAINCGRANAIQTLALILQKMQGLGIDFELADFTGGMARNAIPAKASAVILIKPDYTKKMEQLLQDFKIDFQHIYGNVEKTLKIDLTIIDQPKDVLSKEDQDGLIRLLCVIHTGVYSMSQSIPNLVEASANLGIVETKQNAINVQFFPRSAIDSRVSEFKQLAQVVSELTGFHLTFGSQSPGWAEKLESKLVPLMTSVFEEQNKQPMKVEIIHAGLECGWFFQKNPDLDMVSIGVTAIGIHSPEEKIELATVAPQVKLIMETLTRLKNV